MFDLVDMDRNKHYWEVEETLTDRSDSDSVVSSSYLDRVLDKRLNVGLLVWPRFYSIVYSVHSLV